jgi:hypothetical protein
MAKEGKSLAALIVGGMGKKDLEADIEGSEDSYSEYDTAAEEILSAIKERDSASLSEALKAFFQMCKSDEEGVDEEE